MGLFRTRRASLLVVWALLLSLLPAVAAPATVWAQHSPGPSYAGWLRGQLPVPADASFEEALAAADASRAASLTDYLDAFLSAYASANPQSDLAEALRVPHLNGQTLRLYLESRFKRLGGEALPVRSSLSTAVARVVASIDRYAFAAIATDAPGHTVRLQHHTASTSATSAALPAAERHAPAQPRAP